MVALPLDASAIQRLLPHRYPFLLIDRVTELSAEDKRCVALKNVSINEPFFAGHFPGHPIMPGVLILEAMAQSSAILAMVSAGKTCDDVVVYLLAFERAKFRRPVVPGDQLRIETTIARGGGKIWKFRSEATVEGQVAAEAEYLATFQPRADAPAHAAG